MGLDGMASARGHRMQGTEHDRAFFLALGYAIALHCIALHCIALHCIVVYCIWCGISTTRSRNSAELRSVQAWIYDIAFVNLGQI